MASNSSTGDDLVGKLPYHPNHPNRRNPYAHVALKVKNRFGCVIKILLMKSIKRSLTKNT